MTVRVLVLSPRVAPGQLTVRAWDLLRSGAPVVAARDDAHVEALRDSGVDVALGEPPTSMPDAVWIPAPGDPTWPDQLPDEVDVEVVRGVMELPGSRLLDVVAVMGRLRRECAWTRQQTHESLTRYLLEEAHETLDALDAADTEALRDELGDLLMQVVFHATIAAERPAAETGGVGGGWDVDDVAAGIAAKLVRRNPHVFADGQARTPEEIDAAWQAAKSQEKTRTTPLEGIASGLPALALATKALDRVPELDTSGDDVAAALLRLVAQARADGVDPEAALRRIVRDRAEPTA